MSRRIALIGGGGHALSVFEAMDTRELVAGYVDTKDSEILPLVRLADDSDFLADATASEFEVMITLVGGSDGSLARRRRLIEMYKGFQSPTIIARTAWVGGDVSIGDGTAVMHQAAVNAGTTIGKHSVVNTGAVVEHNCRIGSNVFIGPGAVVCGDVEIGDDTFVGAGAIIGPQVKICMGAVVGLGATVINDITECGTYVGVPARRIK